MTTTIAAINVPTSAQFDDQMFIRVLRDKSADQGIIALNGAGLNALIDLLDLVDSHDVRNNPDSYSMNADAATAVDQLKAALMDQIGWR